MINRACVILSGILFVLMPLCAGARTSIEARMDSIKLNEAYIYGDDCNKDLDVAWRNALMELVNDANEIRLERGKPVLATSDLQDEVKWLQHAVKGGYEVMVYLPVQKLLEMGVKMEDANAESSVGASTADDRPEISKPEKNNDQPAGRDDSPSISPIQQPGLQLSYASPQSLSDVHDAFASQDNWIEIKGLFTAYKKDGIITSNGNVRFQEEVPEDAYSILMDELGGILAVLSPKSSSVRIDYKTGLPAGETIFTDCKFIVWYK